MAKDLTIQDFWKKKNFKPTPKQEEAILHAGSPLFLTAGPGSGKTRVLLWRTVNLLLTHKIKPEEIFLSTFTEKAALQLKDGLRTLLALVTNETKQPFDISKMSIGTVHSICNSIIGNREFSPDRARRSSPKVMDELAQYLFIYNKSNWIELIDKGEFTSEEEAQRTINQFLAHRNASSRHEAVVNVIKLFNRFSEEHVEVGKLKTKDETLDALIKMYARYLEMLQEQHARIQTVDLSLLQQEAYKTIIQQESNNKIYKHIIIDEYQDTNVIQEKIFFELAKGHKNLCVVGDDDQALYRFRGATVENLVEFETRCKNALGVKPHGVPLITNFRSKKRIVDTYNHFISLVDWKKEAGKGNYRIAEKVIEPFKKDTNKSIVVTSNEKPVIVGHELAVFIKRLKSEGKINDYNEVAVLFPAMKGNAKVRDLKAALEGEDIPVYAPRAGRFLQVEESAAVIGLFMHIFGRPPFNPHASGEMRNFQGWLSGCYHGVEDTIKEDKQLAAFIKEKGTELETISSDFEALQKFVSKKRWDEDDTATPEIVAEMVKAAGISEKAKKALNNHFLRELVKNRIAQKNPFKIKYIMNRVTSVDWSVLDLFYRLCGFNYFKKMFDLAENGTDEGPICNLALTSQYIARFTEVYPSVITGRLATDHRFVKLFFNSYSYALFRLQESEYENPDDPFPKGRVPFLTVHQSKGLEFPVVIMGSVFKMPRKDADAVERIIRENVREDGEPIDKINLFDRMRMFYVGLSRAKNLLILPRYKGQAAANDEFKLLFQEMKFPELSKLKIADLPDAEKKEADLGGSYSFTGDYLQYHKCPRQYMIFKKYDFVPSRSQTMFFGSLVHKTIEDLHNHIIQEQKNTANA